MQLNQGPAPKPGSNRRRRNRPASLVTLPASGRSGRPPKWPLIADIVTKAKFDLAVGRLEAEQLQLVPDQRKVDRLEETVEILRARLVHQRKLEAAVWRDLWRLPQAVEWERLGWTREVGQYVRWKVLAELGELDAGKEARQYADRLGLSPMSLLRLRWDVAEDTSPLAAVTPLRPGRPRVFDEIPGEGRS